MMHDEIHVDPRGDDRGAGSQQQPMRTLEAAVALRRARGGGDLRLHGGYHALRQTLVLDRRDQGLRIVAASESSPVIGSGVAVSGWTRHTDRVWRAPLPEGTGSCSALFMGATFLPRARCAGFVPLARWNDWAVHQRHLPCPAGAIPADAAARGGEVRIVPSWPWVVNVLPLGEVDERYQIAVTSVPGTYALGSLNFGLFPRGSCWLENTIEGILEPGQWCVHPGERMIYLRPLDDFEPHGVMAPALTELVRVEGGIDHDSPVDDPVRDIRLSGLTFTHADYRRWTADKTGLGLQHDWEMFDRPTAMLRFRGVEDCSVEHCTFACSGAAGIRCDLHAQRVRIAHNHFHDLGGTGVLLAGYGPGTKDVNHHHTITDNRIHHTGLIEWHAPGIFAWQSGHNLIAHNLIHHVAYSGIVVSGRIAWDPTGAGECSRTIRWGEVEPELRHASEPPSWKRREPYLHGRHNVVEFNDIHHCMQILGDGNGIYISGTGDANLVRHNHIHDIDSPSMNAAIRCDDDQHGVTIHGNVVARTCGEGFILKGTNHVTNNLVYGLRRTAPDGTPCQHQRGFMIFPWADVTGSTVWRNIFVTLDPAIPALTEGAGPSKLRVCDADSNLYFCPTDPDWGRAHVAGQRTHGVEQNSLAADPLFVDAAGGDLRLRDDSPAFHMGFEAIPMRLIGPRGRD